MSEIIKTEKFTNYCKGCNNQVELQKFIAVDEAQSFEEAWEHRHENENDELFKRIRFIGFCLCGNVWLK